MYKRIDKLERLVRWYMPSQSGKFSCRKRFQEVSSEESDQQQHLPSVNEEQADPSTSTDGGVNDRELKGRRSVSLWPGISRQTREYRSIASESSEYEMTAILEVMKMTIEIITHTQGYAFAVSHSIEVINATM